MRLGSLILAFAAACGGGSSSNVDSNTGTNPAPWEGNWNTTGTQSTTCSGVTSTSQMSGLVVIAAGEKAGTIKTTANGCTLIWDLDNANASLESGQMCTVSVSGSNVTITWTQSTSTLATTITGTNTGETNTNCSFMQQYTLTKM
jgi:hypothetical protein